MIEPLESNDKSNSLQVIAYKSFAEDPVFEKARQSLDKKGSSWKTLLHANCAASNVVRTMDSVFFHPDRFEMIVDAREYRPEDLKCNICSNAVEIVAKRSESSNNNTNKTLAMTRSYQLPKQVKPEEALCCLSAEGILYISAPWLQQ